MHVMRQGLYLNVSVFVFGNACYMIFEIDTGLMKALAQETTACDRFPS